MSICGRVWTRCARSMMLPGSGSRVMPTTPAMNGPMRWPTAGWMRPGTPAARPAGAAVLCRGIPLQAGVHAGARQPARSSGCVPRPDRLVPDLTTHPSNSAAPGIAGPLCPEFAKRAYDVQENDAAPGIRAKGRSRSCRMPFCCTFDSDGSGRDDALATLNHVAQAPSDVPGIPLRP